MKRLFTLIAAAMVFVGGYAQTVEWNFSDWEVKEYTGVSTVEGLTIHVDAGDATKKMSLAQSNKTVDDVKFTKTIKLGGAGAFNDDGSVKCRMLYFTVYGPVDISVVAISGKSSENRDLKLAYLENGQTGSPLDFADFTCDNTAAKYTASYTQKAGIVYVYTTSKGVNLYDIKVTPTSSSETVTIGNAGFATYYSANAVDYSSVEGLTAYAVKYADNKLVYTPITGVAKANTPVLLQGEAKEYTLTASTDEAKDVDTDLKAATSAVIGASNIYALANKNNLVAFYQVSDQTSVPAGKCYLEIPASENGASAKAFFALDTETTGISNVDANCKTLENGVAYSLSGQRVGDSYKGIVIINGKKVIRK